ncbi:MAG: glycosyltransferase [Pseudomonadota bacterium]
MNILHLVESLERGGLERVVVNLVLAQQAAGNSVAVCCLFRLGPLAAELRDAGITVVCANKSPGLDLRAVTRIRNECIRTDAQVLHTHNAVANYYGALAAFGRRIRLISTRHGMGAAGVGTKERLYRLSLLRTAAVAAVCEAAKRHFTIDGALPVAKVSVVRNGILCDRFAHGSARARAAARATLDMDPTALVVGTVGRLNWAKNHSLLLDGFAQLLAKHPGSRLVIIGEGELRPAIEVQIAARNLHSAVLLTGDRNDVAALLPAFDVFALTSTTEGYSIALLEAAASGLPVVATDVGGNAEIVQDGITGILCPASSVDGLVHALERLSQSPALRLEMGRRARAWVEQHGSVTAMLRGYDRLYAANATGSASQGAAA